MTNPTPIEAFALYRAVTLHFKTDYDFHKYDGHMNSSATQTAWTRCPQKFTFERLAGKFDARNLVYFFMSNCIHDKTFIVTMRESFYQTWVNSMENLEYDFKCAVNMFFETETHFNDFFTCPPNEYPKVIKNLIGKKISLDTFAILCYTLNIFEQYDKKFGDNVLWEATSKKVKKYFPFVLSYHNVELKPFLQKFKEILKTIPPF